MGTAYDKWTGSERTLVKAYVDNYPGLTDAQMATQMKAQRAVGYWHYSETVDASTESKAFDQFLLDCFTDYSVVSTDDREKIGERINTYIDALGSDALRVAALSKVPEFWQIYNAVGFITAVRTTFNARKINPIVTSDITAIRLLP